VDPRKGPSSFTVPFPTLTINQCALCKGCFCLVFPVSRIGFPSLPSLLGYHDHPLLIWV
jgi:hypothetical protein